MQALRALFIALTVLTAACNDPGTEAGTDTGADVPPTFPEFLLRAESSFCEWSARCGGYADADACDAVEDFEHIWRPDLLASGDIHSGPEGLPAQYLIASQAAGLLAYDAGAALTCLAYVDARGCDRPDTGPLSDEERAGRDACDAVLTGAVRPYDPCRTAFECAVDGDAEAVCATNPNCGEACCPGACRLTTPIGGTCFSQAQCGDDALCLQDPMAPRSICTAKSGPFEPCNRADMCVDGTYCHSHLNQCLPLGEIGESCDLVNLELPCAPDLMCAYPGPDAGAEECVPYVELGASCSLAPDNVVEPDNCRSYTARCSRESFDCVEAPQIGGDCSYLPCAPLANCLTEGAETANPTHTCVGLRTEGQPCDVNWKCLGSLRCDQGTCKKVDFGELCPVPE